MEAPTYPAATNYVEPRLVDSEFGIDSVAVSDLLRSPAIRRILNEEAPGFDARVNVPPELQPYLSTFTVRGLASIGIVPAEALPRIDARLRAVPIEQRPGL